MSEPTFHGHSASEVRDLCDMLSRQNDFNVSETVAILVRARDCIDTLLRLQEGTSHPGYVIGIHWMSAAYARICQGEDEEEVMSDYGWRRG